MVNSCEFGLKIDKRTGRAFAVGPNSNEDLDSKFAAWGGSGGGGTKKVAKAVVAGVMIAGGVQACVAISDKINEIEQKAPEVIRREEEGARRSLKAFLNDPVGLTPNPDNGASVLQGNSRQGP